MLNLRTFEIWRLAEVESGGYKRGYENTERLITGYLETASPEFAAMADGEYTRTFRLFSDDWAADLVAGDRLKEGATVYDVKGVLNQADGPGRKLQATVVLPIKQ